MNRKSFVNILLVILIVTLVGIVGYFVSVKKSILKTQQTSIPTSTQIPPTKIPAPMQRYETANWKTYTDNKIGLSFKYPSTWIINSYNESPDLSIHSSLISDLSNTCGELGTCQQHELNNKKIIEDGGMSGIIFFNGGKGSLIVTCSGNEGGDLVPTPLYEFKFYKDDRVYEIILNDLSTRLSTDSDCNNSKYIQDLIKGIPDHISDLKYSTYNNLLILIKQTLVIK